jgi:hypothetical protein
MAEEGSCGCNHDCVPSVRFQEVYDALARVVRETEAYLDGVPPAPDSWLPAAQAALSLAKPSTGTEQG